MEWTNQGGFLPKKKDPLSQKKSIINVGTLCEEMISDPRDFINSPRFKTLTYSEF